MQKPVFQTAFNAKRDALNEAKLQARLAAEALDITLPDAPAEARQPASRNPDLATWSNFFTEWLEVADGLKSKTIFVISWP